MLLRIRPNLELASRIPHRLGKKLPDGSYLLQHPVECECFLLHSLAHAPHVSYNMAYGRLFCDNCKTEEFVPCPAKRVNLFSREIVMDPSAIGGDLKRFQVAHEDCKPSVIGSAQTGAGVPGSPSYNVEKQLLGGDALPEP